MPEDKTESKPDTTEDPKTDEEHPLDVARREGLRLSPLSQTEHLDTSGGGVTDLHRVSPVFEEARQHAVRQGARAADEEYGLDTVIFPDDKDEADRAREHVRKLAQDLPDEDEGADSDRRPPGGYADGQGQAYNPEMVEADAAARAGQETEATGTNPATGKDAQSEDKPEDDDKNGSTSAKSSSTAAKTPAKSTTTSARSSSTTSKTASK
jgi:hypothetical protein